MMNQASDALVVRTLAELEAVIERGITTFVDVGTALLEIREGRLYRDSHETFEAYCRDRWGFSRTRSYELMDAARIVTEMSGIPDIQPPQNAGQATELSRITGPEERATVWQSVVTEHGPNVTAKHIRQEIERRACPPGTIRHPGTGECRLFDPEPDDLPIFSIVDLETGEVIHAPDAIPGDVSDVAYRIADAAGKAELDRLRYLKKLTTTLGHVAALGAQYDAADVAAMIDADFLRLNIDATLAGALAWAERVRTEMPDALRVIQGGRS